MILTALLLAGAIDAEPIAISRTASLTLAPDGVRYDLELEIRENGTLVASRSLNLAEGQTATLSVGGEDGYRIDFTAAPSPAGWYAPQAADDVFVSSRLFLGGSDSWRRAGDAMVAIDPASEGRAAFDLSEASFARANAAVSRISVSYRLARPAS